ncbi:MAG: hypothetical protein HOP08_15150 [Cyclobacteriaceae bacterium]|nr:hypothetical protein [Cyclobacteriaceae bacterium]
MGYAPKSQIKKNLVKDSEVLLTCKGPHTFKKQRGLILEVTEESFDFDILTNPYEHFSNISAGADHKVLNILIKNVIAVDPV